LPSEVLLRGEMNISGKWGQASCLSLPAVKISETGKYQERARCPFNFHKTIKIIPHLCNAPSEVAEANI